LKEFFENIILTFCKSEKEVFMKRGVFWGTVLVFVALLTVITSAQSLDIHTSALRTNTLEAKVSNGRACLAVPNGMMVVDVSDPSQPELIGQMPSAREIFGLDMRDNMVFLACQGGLGLVDVTDPTQPVLVGDLLSGVVDTVFDVTVAGNYAYAASGTSLVIVDYVNEQHPLAIYPMTQVIRIVRSDNYLLAVDRSDGLIILDVTSPLQPVFVGRYEWLTAAVDVAINGTRVYCIDATGIHILDITNPFEPIPINDYALTYPALDVAVNGSIVSVITQVYDLIVLDMSDPSVPIFCASFDTPWLAQAVTVVGEYAYVVDDPAGLEIISISQPTLPRLIGEYRTPGHSNDICLWGPYLFVSDFNQGLRIIDVADSHYPRAVSACSTGVGVRDVLVDYPYAYLSTDFQGMIIIDINDILNPNVVSQFGTTFVYGLSKRDNIVYLASLWDGLQVVDVSDPAAPQLLASYPAPSCITATYVAGDKLYVVDQNTGMIIFDLADPGQPAPLGYCSLEGYALSILVSGSYAYVANADRGVQIIDVTNPASPFWVAGVQTCYAIDLWLSHDNKLYVADHDFVTIVDVAEPTNPQPLVRQEVIGFATGITAKGDDVFIAACYSVQLAQFDPTGIDDPGELPVTFLLAQNYPNPFNAATTIEYSLAKAGPVQLQVYNVVGQLVETLAIGEQAAGYYQVRWDAGTVASGVYFYRLSSGPQTKTVAMTVLK
jgi:hypothetical protein